MWFLSMSNTEVVGSFFFFYLFQLIIALIVIYAVYNAYDACTMYLCVCIYVCMHVGKYVCVCVFDFVLFNII